MFNNPREMIVSVPTVLGEFTPVEIKTSVTPLPHGALHNGSVGWNLRCG
jgi:hypothetical protein